MAFQDWEQLHDDETYIVYRKIDNRVGSYNSYDIIAKTEEGKWIVFVAIGDGRKTIGNPKNRKQSLELAKSYMKNH